MATSYDEWKTTETFSDEAEFVAKRASELRTSLGLDPHFVREIISAEMADDYDGVFPSKLTAFLLDGSNNGSELWQFLRSVALPKVEREAETQAQAAWDSRLTGPEGDL